MRSDPAYRKRYVLDVAEGISRSRIPAADASGHVRSLLDARASIRSIACAASVSGTTIKALSEGRYATVRRATAERILKVSLADILDRQDGPCARVPATGTIRRIEALLALGHTHAVITAAMGGNRLSAEVVRNRKNRWVFRDTRDAVERAYAALAMTPGASNRTRLWAARVGYVVPLAWDDDEIDDPAATPDTGTKARGIDVNEWLYIVQAGEDPNRAAARLGVTVSGVARAAQTAGRNDIRRMAEMARIREAS